MFTLKSKQIKIGVIPTRREVFNVEEAERQKELLQKGLDGFDAEFINIDNINDSGLLFDEYDLKKAIATLKTNKVDGVFFPHCNFGTEELVARTAKAIGKPVLIWGPRDDAPLEDGMRTRDTQCGLFATGKVLRRFNVTFSYIINSHMEDGVFQTGMSRFIQVCSAVKAFSNIRVLQIAPRPTSFLTMMYNEGELLERFGIQVVPITLQDVSGDVAKVLNQKDADYKRALAQIGEKFDTSKAGKEALEQMAALDVMMMRVAEQYECTAIALQCWDALQDALHIAPCAINGLLTDQGLPVTCETDIHGAVASLLLQGANMRQKPIFFADFTIRHPEKENVELLWHCGNFPPSLARDSQKPTIGNHFNFTNHDVGVGEFEAKGGDITLCRFDGDHGEYSLLFGEGEGIKGEKNIGTYIWFSVKDWPKWEKRLVNGPYVHHCAGIHSKLSHVLYETCRYISGLAPDPIDPSESQLLGDL